MIPILLVSDVKGKILSIWYFLVSFPPILSSIKSWVRSYKNILISSTILTKADSSGELDCKNLWPSSIEGVTLWHKLMANKRLNNCSSYYFTTALLKT